MTADMLLGRDHQAGSNLMRTAVRLLSGGNGRRLYTWCAADTLLFPAILGCRAHVESTCPAGDGALATFDGPARAINCACAIRDAVEDIGLSIRVGLHTGEVEMVAGDVHGIAVHIAARIMALAAPGEVLVSGVIPPLVLGSKMTFNDRGDHELKGVPGSWGVLAVEDSRG
jgi:class 3 adenylate cyclase